MEADPRHAELLIQELTKEESRAISAPGSAEVSEEKEGEELKRRAGKPISSISCEAKLHIQ